MRSVSIDATKHQDVPFASIIFISFYISFSPEVTEEALQVVRVAQFFFALVSTTHQAAPGCVQLSALLLDVIHSLWMRLNQTLSSLTQWVHLPQGEEDT